MTYKVLMSYVFVDTHRSACHTLSNAFLLSIKTWSRSGWSCFSQIIIGLNICSEVLETQLALRRCCILLEARSLTHLCWGCRWTDYSVALALFLVPFLGKYFDEWFCPSCGPRSCHLYLVADDYSAPNWIYSPGMLSLPADFLFLSDFTASSTSSEARAVLLVMTRGMQGPLGHRCVCGCTAGNSIGPKFKGVLNFCEAIPRLVLDDTDSYLILL